MPAYAKTGGPRTYRVLSGRVNSESVAAIHLTSCEVASSTGRVTVPATCTCVRLTGHSSANSGRSSHPVRSDMPSVSSCTWTISARSCACSMSCSSGAPIQPASTTNRRKADESRAPNGGRSVCVGAVNKAVQSTKEHFQGARKRRITRTEQSGHQFL